MEIYQQIVQLAPKSRGFHLVTGELLRQLPGLARFGAGLAHLQLLHTSASLALNENADPDVRHDMELIFNALVPEHQHGLRHTLEGSDDMSAHAKSAIIGTQLSIPVRNGAFLLGTWQGVYLCEHRNQGGPRQMAVTILGETTKRA